MVAGGLPHGISPMECVVKECGEEAGVSPSLASTAIPCGAVSYRGVDEQRQVSLSLRFKRLLLYTIGFLFHVGWCIRQLWYSSITSYNNTSISHNHHTEILFQTSLNIYIHLGATGCALLL